MIGIMISIKPYWYAKILNGEKTIEVRKKFPKDYKGWVYIYCTKDGNQYLYKDYDCDENGNDIAVVINDKLYYNDKPCYCNGKVVARFYCDKLEEIYIRYGEGWVCGNLRINEIEKKTCLSRFELYDYLKNNRSRGYAIHISQLEIFDKPKELREFVKWYPYYKRPYELITKAPQNMCYCEVEDE